MKATEENVVFRRNKTNEFSNFTSSFFSFVLDDVQNIVKYCQIFMNDCCVIKTFEHNTETTQ
jgi:hypothetical protein